MKRTKPTVDHAGKSQSLKIWNQVTTTVAPRTVVGKPQLLPYVFLSHAESELPINGRDSKHDPRQVFTSAWGLEVKGLCWTHQNLGLFFFYFSGSSNLK